MEQLKHECGVAMIRLLKPLEYYEEKYGTWMYGLNKLYLLMEKQHNRGQEGAGLACVKLEANPGEEPLEGAWEMRGDSVIVTIEDSAMAFVLEGGSLVFDSSALDDGSSPEINIRLTFRRERPEAGVFDPGTALTDVTLADFDGTWNDTLTRIGGRELTPAEIGMEITIKLSGGEGRFLQKYAASAETIEFSVVGELTADGALILSGADGNAQSALYRLYDSGVMACLEEGEGGLSGAIYFERAEAGAEE